MINLTVEKRNKKDSPEFLAKTGKIPAVFYGKKEASTTIAVSKAEFKKVWREAGESSIVHLSGEGIDLDTLIFDVALNPVTDQPIHVDFYAIEKGKKLEISVPIEFIGVAPAVKDLGGILVKVLHEIEIEALPKDLPREIKVDIKSLLTLDSQILAKDLVLPEGVTLMTKPEDVVAAIAEAKEEEVAPVVADVSTIEVEKKGKEAKEGAEGEAAPEEGKKEKK